MNFMENKTRIVILPLFFDEHESFWRDADEGELLLRVIKEMQQWSCIDEIRSFTDDPDLARQVRELGVRVDTVSAPSAKPSPLPRGTAASLARLATDGGAPLLIVRDIRQPLIREEEVRSMVDSWIKCPDAVLAAVGIPRDHPCQFFQGFTIKGAGFLHHGDEDDPDMFPGFWISRPCRLPLGAVLPASPATDFWELTTIGSKTPRSLTLGQARSEGASLVRFSADGTARLFLPQEKIAAGEGRLAGVSLAASNAPAATLHERQGVYLLLFADEFTEDASHLMICANNGTRWVETVYPLNSEVVLDFAPQAEGLFYFLVNPVHEGKSDLLLPYADAFNRWQIVNSILVRTDTGEVIYGRQSFPETYLLDVALSMGARETLCSFDVELAAGRVRGWPVSFPAEKIKNVVDHLYYSVARRIN